MSEHLERRDASEHGLPPRAGGPTAGGHVDDLVAGHVLAALAPDEHALVERHARICLRCARLVTADRRAVAPLGLLVPPASPGPRAKHALLARIADARTQDAAGLAATAPLRVRQTITLPAPAAWSAPAPPVLRTSATAPLPAPKRRWIMPPAALSRLAAVPLVLALALAGGWALGDQPTTDRGSVLTDAGPVPTSSTGARGASVGTLAQPSDAAVGKLVGNVQTTSVGGWQDDIGAVGGLDEWTRTVPSTDWDASRAVFTGGDVDLGSTRFSWQLGNGDDADFGDDADIGT